MRIKKLLVDDFENIIKCLPKETAKEVLRSLREEECYSIINRGTLWYETLTNTQKNDLFRWYNEWKDVTDTFVCPVKPYWLR